MKRFIIIDPVLIEVFKPRELEPGPEITGLERKPRYDRDETQIAPGIYLFTVTSNFFTARKNTKLIKY